MLGQNELSLEHFIFSSKFFSQFKAFAINLAVVVFPTPLIPVKRYAFGVLPSLMEFSNSLSHNLLTN